MRPKEKTERARERPGKVKRKRDSRRESNAPAVRRDEHPGNEENADRVAARERRGKAKRKRDSRRESSAPAVRRDEHPGNEENADRVAARERPEGPKRDRVVYAGPGRKEKGTMTEREKKERAVQVIAALKEVYPEAVCALCWEGDPWRLLVLGRLSAQCTDKRVNEIAPALFAAFPTARDMAAGEIGRIEELVRPCGLYRMKARDLKESARQITEDFGGRLPDTMEELLTLSGVGRKIANLLLGDVWGAPAVVTDTHCIRICGRLGFYPESEKDPVRIERILRGLLPPEEGAAFCHRIVDWGRDVCTARSPKCADCLLAARGLCEKARRDQAAAAAGQV